ncbi:MAG: hypothetical protein WCK80_04145 [bacterium]
MDNDKKNSIIASIIIIVALVSFFAIIAARGSEGEISNSQTTDSNLAEPTSTCFTPENVRDHYSENGCVEFTVGYTYETAAGTKFIDEKEDYKNGFVIYIPKDSAFSDTELSQYEGKKVRVSGLISQYNGYPQISVTGESQVEILD